MGFITDATLQAYVAAALKKSVTDLTTLANGQPSYWPTLITQANLMAWGEISDRLIRRGWTIAQVNGWDRGAEAQTAMGLYFALRDGGALDGFSEVFINDKLRYFDQNNPKNVLDNTLVTNGTVWQVPADSPGTVGTGPLDTSEDMFVLPDKSQDPRIGQQVRW